MSQPPAAERALSASDRFRLARDVRFRVIVEEGVILRQQSAEVLVINEVGARLLDLVDPSRDLGRIGDRLEEEFDVERSVLDADVAAFVTELLAAGVLERVPAAAE